jgi:hypothetical protein
MVKVCAVDSGPRTGLEAWVWVLAGWWRRDVWGWVEDHRTVFGIRLQIEVVDWVCDTADFTYGCGGGVGEGRCEGAGCEEEGEGEVVEHFGGGF